MPQPSEIPQEQEPVRPRVSVTVVSHNRVELLRRCLEALERSTGRETIQVILVDNGSTDGSGALESEFPNVRFMRLPRNFGLTKALNIGIRASQADYLFLLHDDTELQPDTVSVLADTLDARTDAGAVCPLLVDQDGRPTPQVGVLPPDGNWEPAEPAGEPFPVPYATGAALMVRSFFFKAMRHIDERYGQFGSDAELCYQIRRAGKHVLLVPAVLAVHTPTEDDSDALAVDFQLARATYIAKHSGFLSGILERLRGGFSALAGFRLGRLFALISGQKIDGTQKTT